MKRERLTIKNIKADLLNEIKGGFVEIAALTIFLLVLLVFAFFVPFSVLKICFVCIALVTAFLLAKLILELLQIYSALHNSDCIVNDKLVGMEEEEKLTRYGSIYIIHHLHFSSYGEYIIPNENYKWSSMFAMSAKGLYNYATCGDEFYLVLSKQHTGKILYVYNTKMFEMK